MGPRPILPAQLCPPSNSYFKNGVTSVATVLEKVVFSTSRSRILPFSDSKTNNSLGKVDFCWKGESS